MTTPAPPVRRTAHAVAARARDLYFALYGDPDGAAADGAAYLRQLIANVRDMPAELPPDLHLLKGWMEERVDAVGAEYREYLAARKQGAPRRYFSSRAHALYFIKGVAPTKLVDGAWLYGLLRHWDDPDVRPLIRTYLEELGDGVPDKNHVRLYRKLLGTHSLDHWAQLPDDHFVQGAIQLALACNADQFLPEIVGYNLGYEQLPLHLLITSYELNELGIDPYYFTLHVTVDNAATGHAHKAVQAVEQMLPACGDRDAFYRRVLDGYLLNEPGASTTSVIRQFDLEQELVHILAGKSTVGKSLHSDYCRVAGRSVNDWLSSPANIPGFLDALQAAGWISRGEAPEHSRFWRLVSGERADMFGVFSAYELEVLREWIASTPGAAPASARVISHRARQRTLDNLGQQAPRGPYPERGLIRRHAHEDEDRENELRQLEARVAAASGKQEAMDMLAGLMSPALHHTPAGLMATRMFARLLDA
ncbi:MAG: iron-containing redox enzyme family protein [Telluria sp.]